MYFSTYQAIAHDEVRPGLYKEFPPDFFDLVIVDECHRGSAKDESNWREILEYFKPAVQLGMTATPLRADNKDTYRYFGNPIYTYSLRAGHRRRLPRAVSRPPRRHDGRRCGMAPIEGRPGPVRPRDPRPGVRHQGLRALGLAEGADGGDRPPPDRLHGADRSVRQDDRLLRRPGARRGDAPGSQQPAMPTGCASSPTTSAG